MIVRSLGYRTDLMLRALEGSQVTDRGDHLVIRTPANPAYWWGNFLLLAAPPGPGQAAGWLARFDREFPGAGHVAVGIDVTDDQGTDAAGLVAAGLRRLRDAVMTASAVRPPPHRNDAVSCRPLSGDGDWRQCVGLRMACFAGEPGMDRAFAAARAAAERRLTETGHGAWFGAFRDGQLLAQLGLVTDGSGIARYQNVETHPAARRQGLAGTLVWTAGQYGLAELAASILVMVADPEAGAIRVYRSAGFTEGEIQVGFERPPAVAQR